MIDREKILSVGIKKASRKADEADRALSSDLDAYKRLRRNGLQPPRIDGSARLEKEAVTALEVQTGVVSANLTTRERRQMADRLSGVEFEKARFVR